MFHLNQLKDRFKSQIMLPTNSITLKFSEKDHCKFFFFFFFERISAGCCLSLSFSLLSTFHSFPLAENLGGDFHPEGK